jgi:hypothetical protein
VVYFIGETEEYEPLSRAAYYRLMRKMQIKIKILSHKPPPKERELVNKI